MKVYNTTDLLHNLKRDVEGIRKEFLVLKTLTKDALSVAPKPDSWSIAQVLEHLNSYNRYYLIQIEQRMKVKSQPNATYKPGWLGDYFTKLMQPKANGTIGSKQTAPKDHTPPAQLDVSAVLAEFEAGTAKLLQLLHQADSVDLSGIRVPITLTKLIRLKLGDTFRFLIAHQQRHFIQINKAKAALGLTENNAAIKATMATTA